MKGRLLHEHRPLLIYEVTPDHWEWWVGMTPPARLFSALACPAAVLGLTYLATRPRLSGNELVVGVMLVVTLVACLYFLTSSVQVRLTREGAERKARFFGIPWTTRLTFSRDAPPRMGVQRTDSGTSGGQRNRYFYQAILEVRGQELPVGPGRKSLQDAEDDCAWLRRFFGLSEFGLTKTKDKRRLSDWVSPLAPGGSDATCPLCRELLSAQPVLVECQGCSTGYHQECAAEFGDCSTLGCTHHLGHRRQRA